MSREDLIPFNRRTEDEQKEIAKKGGVKSGESRRRKRAFKQLAKQYLDADTGCAELRSELVAHGFDNDFSNAAALIMVIGKEAFSGNLRAAELLIRLSGEDPDRAVAAKTHEGSTGGLDTRIYLRRARESLKGVGERLAALNKAKAALLK